MSDRVALLDASALLAFLFQETGNDTVEAILNTDHAAATALGVAEALNVCRRKEHELDRATLRTLLSATGLQIEPVTADDAVGIATLLAQADAYRSAHRGTRGMTMSIADATCIAVAQRLQIPVITSDRHWSELGLEGVDIRQFR